MHWHLSALHVPYSNPALHEPAYACSRKAVIESSIKLWSAVNPSSSIVSMQSQAGTTSSDQDVLRRLMICGSGIFRTVAYQASMLIAIELKTQLQEEHGLGRAPLRQDLLAVVNEAKACALQYMKAGETNAKGYLLLCLLASHIEGLSQNFEQDQLAKSIVRAGEEAAEVCISILEGMATQGQAESSVNESMLIIGLISEASSGPIHSAFALHR